MAKPYVGQIVVVRTQDKHNGASVHPGIVTRVWSDNDPSVARNCFACVSIKVLPDCGAPFDQTSTYLFDREPDTAMYPYAAWPAVAV